jgi:hypothetical protein
MLLLAPIFLLAIVGLIVYLIGRVEDEALDRWVREDFEERMR